MAVRARADEVPEPGTYCKVMVHPRLHATLRKVPAPLFLGYHRTYRTKRIPWPDGTLRFAVFFEFDKDNKGRAAAQRAFNMGWQDYTEEWMRQYPEADRPTNGQGMPGRPGAVEHAVRSLAWRALQQEAKENGLPADGNRLDLENRLIDHLTGAASPG